MIYFILTLLVLLLQQNFHWDYINLKYYVISSMIYTTVL